MSGLGAIGHDFTLTLLARIARTVVTLVTYLDGFGGVIRLPVTMVRFRFRPSGSVWAWVCWVWALPAAATPESGILYGRLN